MLIIVSLSYFSFLNYFNWLAHLDATVAKKKHRASPIWLRNFEIVTGSSVGLLFLVIIFSACSLCNIKRSLIVPWKKSANEKEKFTVYVG